jgi:hypothetical protein
MGVSLTRIPARVSLPLLLLCWDNWDINSLYAFYQEVAALYPVGPDEQWRRGFLGDTPPVWLASADEVGF